MRKSVLHIIPLTFIVTLMAPAAPAFATQTSQALAICVSRGLDCTVSNKGGGHEICVNNTGGKQCVQCPALTAKDQTCTVAAKSSTGKRITATVDAVLKNSSK
jgi:hypothetical protein